VLAARRFRDPVALCGAPAVRLAPRSRRALPRGSRRGSESARFWRLPRSSLASRARAGARSGAWRAAPGARGGRWRPRPPGRAGPRGRGADLAAQDGLASGIL